MVDGIKKINFFFDEIDFIKDYHKVKLHDYQKEMISDMCKTRKNTIIVGGTSKSNLSLKQLEGEKRR